MINWYYLAFFSAILMGIATVLEKKMLKVQHATIYSAEFSIVTMIVSLILIPFASFNINIAALAILYLLSLTSTVSYLLTAKVYRHSYLSLTTPLFSSLPVMFSVFLAFTFLGEQLTLFQYLSILIIIVATFLLLAGDKSLEKKTSGGKTYLSLLVFTTFVSAIGYVIMKYLLAINVDPFAFSVLGGAFTAINMTIYMILRYGGVREIVDNIKKYEISIIALALLSISYRIAFYFAVIAVPVSLALPFRSSINTIFTVLLGGYVFKEANIPKIVTLSIIMIVFSYMLVT